MFELSKETAVRQVLEKRFGKTDPEEIEELFEINLWYAVDEEMTPLGINVELKYDNGVPENYQVNKEGIVFSWGDAPIIDERSQNTKLNLETVYRNLSEDEDDDI
jgi:hypothetical protein